MKKTPLKRNKRLNPISKAPHRREARFWPKDVAEAIYERSGGICEAPAHLVDDWYPVGRCYHTAIDKHHVLPRSRGGKSTVENGLHLCRTCHNITLNDPKLAIKLGILK